MNLPQLLNQKQLNAFTKRASTGTIDQLAESLILEQAQTWAEQDYQATAATLTAALKDQPQDVLDGIITQLSAL